MRIGDRFSALYLTSKQLHVGGFMLKCFIRYYVLILTLGLGTLPLTVQAQSRLEQIANSLEENSTIEHVESGVVLNGLAQNNPTVILFDVRTEEEFSVRHLANAIRLDPETNPLDFLREYGNLHFPGAEKM